MSKERKKDRFQNDRGVLKAENWLMSQNSTASKKETQIPLVLLGFKKKNNVLKIGNTNITSASWIKKKRIICSKSNQNIVSIAPPHLLVPNMCTLNFLKNFCPKVFPGWHHCGEWQDLGWDFTCFQHHYFTGKD